MFNDSFEQRRHVAAALVCVGARVAFKCGSIDDREVELLVGRAETVEKVEGLIDHPVRPRSVAVIGASRRKQSIGHEILHNLIEFGYSGPVFPVNPSGAAVHSMKSYRKLADVPDPVDLAVIVVPRDAVPSVIDQCARKGVRGVVVITAGFKEVGPDGARVEQTLLRKLKRHGAGCGERRMGAPKGRKLFLLANYQLRLNSPICDAGADLG